MDFLLPMKNIVTAPATGTAKPATATTPPRNHAPGASAPAKSPTPAESLSCVATRQNHAELYELSDELDRSPFELFNEILQVGIAATKRVNRIARQLDIPPGEVLARILDMGVATVDHNLMWENSPFELEGELAEYSPTAELDAMTVTELDALEASHDGHTAQRVLYVAHCQKTGTVPDGCYRAD